MSTTWELWADARESPSAPTGNKKKKRDRKKVSAAQSPAPTTGRVHPDAPSNHQKQLKKHSPPAATTEKKKKKKKTEQTTVSGTTVESSPLAAAPTAASTEHKEGSGSHKIQQQPKKKHPPSAAAQTNASDGCTRSPKLKSQIKRPAPTSPAAAAAECQLSKRARLKPAERWTAEQTHDTHKFSVEFAVSDHAETPLAAYQDIAPLLQQVACSVAETPPNFKLWDPFFCAGTMQKHLGSLGFKSVINRNVDFYATSPPSHQMLITNPPFSGDHLNKVVEFVAARSEPFALLMPSFVLGRAEWHAAAAAKKPAPFYVVPNRRYSFSPPPWAMGDGVDAGATTSPFTTFWFCWAPAAVNAKQAKWSPQRVKAFWNLADVPSEHRDMTDAAKKRPNPKLRKKLAARRKQLAAAY